MDPALTKDDRIRLFLESLGKAGRYEDWQVDQAEQALRLYFVNFKGAQEPLKAPVVSVDIQATGRVRKEDVLEALKNRLRIRHYSYRTEQTYVDWISRFFAYLNTRGNDGTEGYAVTEAELRDFRLTWRCGATSEPIRRIRRFPRCCSWRGKFWVLSRGTWVTGCGRKRASGCRWYCRWGK